MFGVMEMFMYYRKREAKITVLGNLSGEHSIPGYVTLTPEGSSSG